ncbi:MAG TPA: hypothetical protein H9795_03725 [Candidatus Fournierella merdigallinarum]|nr:hypothetical protein [Candidatus Fournierella merdigallinarum]
MNVHLTVTKKTYYALGLLAAGCTLAAGIGAITGFSMALADNVAMLLTLLMLGFLASVKGTSKKDKQALVGCILLQLLALALPVALLQHLLMSLVWPCFAGWEKSADPRLAPQFRTLAAAEAVWFAARVLVQLGGAEVLGLFMNLCGVAAAAARGWLALTLYRRQRDES